MKYNKCWKAGSLRAWVRLSAGSGGCRLTHAVFGFVAKVADDLLGSGVDVVIDHFFLSGIGMSY